MPQIMMLYISDLQVPHLHLVFTTQYDTGEDLTRPSEIADWLWDSYRVHPKDKAEQGSLWCQLQALRANTLTEEILGSLVLVVLSYLNPSSAVS